MAKYKITSLIILWASIMAILTIVHTTISVTTKPSTKVKDIHRNAFHAVESCYKIEKYGNAQYQTLQNTMQEETMGEQWKVHKESIEKEIENCLISVNSFPQNEKQKAIIELLAKVKKSNNQHQRTIDLAIQEKRGMPEKISLEPIEKKLAEIIALLDEIRPKINVYADSFAPVQKKAKKLWTIGVISILWLVLLFPIIFRLKDSWLNIARNAQFLVAGEKLAVSSFHAEDQRIVHILQQLERLLNNYRINRKKLLIQRDLLTKAISYVVIHMNKDGVVLEIKGEENYHLSFPKNRIIGKKLNQILAPKVVNQVMSYVQTAIKSNREQQFEGQLLIEGKKRYYCANVIPSNNDILITVQETTRQRVAEEEVIGINEKLEKKIAEFGRSQKALEKQSKVLHSILESIGDGMIVIDNNGTFLLVNPAAEEIMGTELMGSTINEWSQQWSCFLPDTSTPYPYKQLPFIQAIQGREIDDAEIFAKNSLRPGGIWLSINARPLKDITDSMKGGVVMFRDITERKKAEEALRKSEAKNWALLNAIPDLMFRIKKNGTFLGFVAAKSDDPATTPRNIVGQKVENVFPSKVAGQIMTHVTYTFERGETQIFEYQIMENDILRDYEARIVESVENEVLAIVRDITDRKKVERMKNEFISTVSHELRTPLTSIRGSLGLIVGGLGGALNDQGKNLANIALNNTERLVRLINDILDIQKIESGKMLFHIKWIKLMPLVEQTIESNKAYGEQFGVTFQLKGTIPGLEVEGDGDRLMQVITNLLSNAAKFSPANDTVEIEIKEVDEKIRVSVSDHGPGIPDNFHGRIFEKFAQADSSDTRKKGGTGLGLSIAKSIIEKHGGMINFESECNVCTTFYFDLPKWRLDK